MLEAQDGAPGWPRAIRWFAAVTGIAAGMLLALKLPASGWGFVLFAASSIAWIISGVAMGVRSLVVVNGVLLLTNIIGIYRWLPT